MGCYMSLLLKQNIIPVTDPDERVDGDDAEHDEQWDVRLHEFAQDGWERVTALVCVVSGQRACLRSAHVTEGDGVEKWSQVTHHHNELKHFKHSLSRVHLHTNNNNTTREMSWSIHVFWMVGSALLYGC